MEIHTSLSDPVNAFSFSRADLDDLTDAFPGANLVVHQDDEALLTHGSRADVLLSWRFEPDWHARLPNLALVMTPAAGKDWIKVAPETDIEVIHGTFHGSVMSESVLSALLFMNHNMPGMWRNFQARAWDRNLQSNARLLRNQTVIFIGYGSIGQRCAELVRLATGASVIGVKRQVDGRRHRQDDDIPVFSVEALPALLGTADHVVLILPGDSSTDDFFDTALIQQCKPGVTLYNFGRGNALTSETLINNQHHIGGAFLDVTDIEPLPADSALWAMPNLMITPHSSCVYQDYRAHFVTEVTAQLKRRFSNDRVPE